MGLLGLRKFIDSCGCTRLLPVPVSDTEAEEETLRRLRVEGYHEVADDEKEDDGGQGDGLYLENGQRHVHAGANARASRLTSSTHVPGAANAGAGGSASHSGKSTAFSTPTPVVDHVLVDMNCIVHSCFHHQNSENKAKKQLIQEVLERLRVLLTEVVVPRQSLSICFDGPAPIAKLQTQRLRRRKVSLLDTGSIQHLNTLSITAGSLFMIELENAIASQFKLNHGRGFLRRACPVYLYGTTVMGEGEAKISRALAFLAYGHATSNGNNTSTVDVTSAAAAAAAKAGAAEEAHNDRYQRNGRRGYSNSSNSSNSNSNTYRHASTHAGYTGRAFTLSHPDDSIVVLGNDIDLVVTCLGATAFHNFSIVSPSSLQLIRVSDIIYRWLKATSATTGDTPFSPAQLPSIRIDFIYLFLLNGGDHYAGAGEVAMSLWKRYRSVRATYPYSTLVSPNLDAIDIDFLADVVQASEYTGSSSVEMGMDLLQSALWSLYTVVTGVCPNYNYVPEPAAPQLCHLRAAAAHCQRTNKRIRLADFKAQSQPLTPLETYVALMPTEATLPKSITAGLHSKATYQSILKTLETSNDTAMIAQAAKDAVEVSAAFLTASEQYLRHFTSPVQLNVIPPRRRLSRHEQHRLMATQGHAHVEDPVPVVKPVAMPEEVPYMEVPYPPHTAYLDFYSPFDPRTNTGATTEEVPNTKSSSAVVRVQGRAVSTRPSLHATNTVFEGAPAASNGTAAHASAHDDGLEHRRVSLHQEQAAREQRQQERQTASAKLQRTLSLMSNILQRGQHFTPAQERHMRRKLQRLRSAETAEMLWQSTEEAPDGAPHGEGDAEDGSDGGDLEAELRQFLGTHASSEDVAALLRQSAAETAQKKRGSAKKVATKAAKEAARMASAVGEKAVNTSTENSNGGTATGAKKRARKEMAASTARHDEKRRGGSRRVETANKKNKSGDRCRDRTESRSRSVDSSATSHARKKQRKAH